jgi:hypothetical protein
MRRMGPHPPAENSGQFSGALVSWRRTAELLLKAHPLVFEQIDQPAHSQDGLGRGGGWSDAAHGAAPPGREPRSVQ